MRCRIDAALWLSAGLAFVVPGAFAQSANCEAFKARVAAGLDAKGVAGYALDLVPGRVAAPSGARVIGTCDGGAYTLLYRRWADAAAGAMASVEPAEPASQAKPKAVPPKPQPVAAAKTAEPASAAASRVAAGPALAPARETQPAAVPAPTQAPEPAATPSPAAVPATGPSAVTAPAAPSPAGSAQPSSFDVNARRVAWVVAGVLVVGFVVRLVRRWRHRRYYDEAGLPRGPRITL